MPAMWLDKDGVRHKECGTCNEIYNYKHDIDNNFSRSSMTRDGLSTYCHRCENFRHWRKQGIIFIKHPDDIWKEQKGYCAACKEFISNAEDWYRSGAHLDHDHVTGIAGGFIHFKCNVIIGGYEKVGRNKNILAYLTRLGRRV